MILPLAARGSMELALMRAFVTFSDTMCSALANAASDASLLPIISVNATLLGASSHTAGAPGLIASSTPMTAGSGTYPISISSAASRASRRFSDDEGHAVAYRAHPAGASIGRNVRIPSGRPCLRASPARERRACRPRRRRP